MNTKELYLRASTLAPLEQNEFLDRLAECLAYLENVYPRAILSHGEALVIPGSLDESANINRRFESALILGVIARTTHKTEDRAAFVAEADAAYLALWREAAKGRQIGKPKEVGE
jgi:hypothetical protein